MSMFTKATKAQAKLRLALQGPSGGGKTYSALSIATAMGAKVAVVDTEFGSASKYADKFSFDRAEITDDYNPLRFVEALKDAGDAGYDVVVIDSLSHSWNGAGGFLDLVDQEVKRMISKGHKADSFAAWKNITPIYNRLVDAILGCKCHVICTLRAKQEYEKVKNDNGKVEVKKIGMAPEMRDNFQFALDIEGMLTMEHDLVIGKTRCPALDGKVFNKPGKDFAAIVTAWLSDGAPAPEPEIDWKVRARDAYKNVDSQKAAEIAAKFGQDFKGMYGALVEAANG